MKAAMLVEPGRIELRELAEPHPGPGEVLVRLRSCGVCATDVKKFIGASKAPCLPFLLGHEPAGSDLMSMLTIYPWSWFTSFITALFSGGMH